MTNEITRDVAIAAPLEKVWAALTDHVQFGQWFKVALDQPFALGEESTGQMTVAGYEGYGWLARVVAIEPMTRFAYDWPAAGGDKALMARARPITQWTRVGFRLEPTPTGTHVTVTESGLDALTEPHRSNVLRSNSAGWTQQMENIRAYAER